MSDAAKPRVEERFEKLITVLISSVAILVAITAFLQNYASNIAGQANRRAQELSIQSTTRNVTGAIQLSYDWESAFQNYHEVDLQIVAAQQTGDSAAEARLTKLRDRLASLSPILGAPYFDAAAKWPDTNQYVSDLYWVEATRLSEQYQAEARVGKAWSASADRFVIQLTLLTVALSLYGLSLTLKGGSRWLFVIVGSGIVGLCAIWLGVELILPKPQISEKAIDAYAKAVGLAYVGRDKEAIQSFDNALSIKSDYANAFYERANSYYNLGNFERAAADFVSAREAGRDDINVNWNLGWTYYLLGRYDDAIQTNRVILDKDSTVLGMRMNQGLTKLAKGDFEGAKREYDLLIGEAERQVKEAHAAKKEPSAGLWFYMDAGAADLQNLIDQLNEDPKDWTFAPDARRVTADHKKVKDLAYQQMVRIKEAVASLEYKGSLPTTKTSITVTPFKFGTAKYDEQGQVTQFDEAKEATFPDGTDSVTLAFEYSGAPSKTPLIWKVYRNGVEDPSFREIWEYADYSTSKGWYKFIGYDYTNIFIFLTGEYTVELYADYRLV